MSVISEARHPAWRESVEFEKLEDFRESLDAKMADLREALNMAVGPRGVEKNWLVQARDHARAISDLIDEWKR